LKVFQHSVSDNNNFTVQTISEIVRLVAFDNVASILLQVWTGLKLSRGDRDVNALMNCCQISLARRQKPVSFKSLDDIKYGGDVRKYIIQLAIVVAIL